MTIGLAAHQLLTILVAFVLLILSPAAWAADLVLDRNSDHIVSAEINGHPLKLRVDPGSSGYIILNPAAASAAGLKGSLIGSETSVGPFKLHGKSNRVTLVVAAKKARPRVVWMDRDVVHGADGIISPEALPYDNVTLEGSSAGEGETTADLPMQYNHGTGIFFPYSVGGETVIVRFSTVGPSSLATASAAALIAAQHGGGWSGEASRQAVRFGIERPTRPMRLQRSARFDAFTVSEFLVRTADNRGNHQLPTEAEADPDEIVVTGKSKKQPRRLHLTLGLDRLAACSSITYRKATRSLSLTCRAKG